MNNIRQLQYIIAVDKNKHFGKAADDCFVSQATLSAMIKKYEDEYNIVLFDRSRKPVKTTAMGMRVIEHAKKILTDVESMERDLAAKNHALSGEILLGIIPTVASILVPWVVPSFLTAHPDLHLVIKELNTEQIIDHIHAEKIHLGILATPLKDQNVFEYPLYQEAMYVYGDFPERQKYANKNNLQGSQIWLLGEGHCFRTQSMNICGMKREHIGNSRLSFEGNSFETLMRLADHFGGFTLLPESYIIDMDDDRMAKIRPFQPPTPMREISIISKHLNLHSRVIDALQKHITTRVKDKLTSSPDSVDLISIY